MLHKGSVYILESFSRIQFFLDILTILLLSLYISSTISIKYEKKSKERDNCQFVGEHDYVKFFCINLIF